MNRTQPPKLPAELRDAYLGRIAANVEAPSIDSLRGLQRSHVRAIPHESTWIHLGETWDLDPQAAITRFTQGRGGYCFHLNGGFAALLHTLGYEVTWHSGAVHGGDDPTDGDVANHLVLVVHGLMTDQNPGGRWYVDVGLGDGPIEPLPLRAGSYDQAPMTYEIAERAGDAHRWRFHHDPALGNFPAMAFTDDPVTMDVFAGPHGRLSTDPATSPFASMCMAFHRTPEGADALRVLTFVETRTERTSRVIEHKDEWFDVLADVFGITLDGVDDVRREALWAKTHAAHEAHLAAKDDPAS